jgi:hypothetical protein
LQFQREFLKIPLWRKLIFLSFDRIRQKPCRTSLAASREPRNSTFGIMEGTMKTILLSTMITAIFLYSLPGQAVDTQHPPVFHAGDSWLYRHYEVDSRNAFRISLQTVRSVTSTQVNVDSRRIDSKEADEVLEWKVDEDPLPFPVSVGKTWEKKILRKGVEVGGGPLQGSSIREGFNTRW